MKARGILLAAPLLLLASVSLSGCLDCPTGPPVTARDVGPSADSSAGLVGFELRLRVTDEPGGPPLEGAGVVVYWARDDVADWGKDVSVQVDGSGERVTVVAEPGTRWSTPEAKSTHRLRTDAGGEAVARVPSNRIVGVVVAAEGYTEEWIPALATGGGSSSDTVTVPLYRANLSGIVEDTWGPGAASSGTVTRSGYQWKPTTFPFGATEEATRGYVARMASLSARLEWTNGLGGAGDLGIGLGPTRDEPTFLEDSANDLSAGARAEELAMDAARLKEVGVLASPTAYLGPGTDSGFVAPFGLPYRLTVSAVFDTAAAAYAACANDVEDGSGVPGAGVPLGGALPVAALALAAVALAATRRRA